MASISPFLWFDGQAEEAARYYVDTFPDSEFLEVLRFGAEGPGPAGSVMLVRFRILGQEVAALNGGPQYALSPAFSFSAACDSQTELDHVWERLLEGGQVLACGWLTDRFGLTWQVVPSALAGWMSTGDPVATGRVMQALWGMVKLDIATLERAFRGE
jgi:predicted 3-demethylubiquinone-9 3-methyltransferase (glyoxalase superfamily)